MASNNKRSMLTSSSHYSNTSPTSTSTSTLITTTTPTIQLPSSYRSESIETTTIDVNVNVADISASTGYGATKEDVKTVQVLEGNSRKTLLYSQSSQLDSQLQLRQFEPSQNSNDNYIDHIVEANDNSTEKALNRNRERNEDVDVDVIMKAWTTAISVTVSTAAVDVSSSSSSSTSSSSSSLTSLLPSIETPSHLVHSPKLHHPYSSTAANINPAQLSSSALPKERRSLSSISHSHSHSHSDSYSFHPSPPPISYPPSHFAHSHAHLHSYSSSHSLALTNTTLNKSRSRSLLVAPILNTEEPQLAFYHAFLTVLGQSPLKLFLSVPFDKLKPQFTGSCCFLSFLDLNLEIYRHFPFQTLFSAYALPLLWILAPGVGFLFSVFKAFSLLTSGIIFLVTDPEQSLDNMNPYSSPPSFSASTLPSPRPLVSTPSLEIQIQLRQDQPIGHHHLSSFSNMARPDDSSDDTTSSPHQTAPFVSYNDTTFNNQTPLSHNSASSSSNTGNSRTSNPVPLSRQFNHHVAHGVFNQNSGPIHHHHSNINNNINSNNHNHSHQAQNFDSSSHANDEDEGLDEEEDRQSDEGSEEEPGFNDMEYWLQRCSICFDAKLDFCLELCRDQFCRDCFQRYVKEVVSNSWGLNVTKIKCPVCQDTIAQSEWTRYVDQSTLTQYNQYNQPYRSFSRFCNQCDHELVISHVNRSALGLPARELQPFFDCLLEELRSLLILAGLNIDDTGTHPHDASKQCLTSHDIFARQIVQSFTDDYKSFCEISQESQLSLPSKAQSYLSNIAYRTLGAPFISPTPPPNLASSGSSNHPPSLPQQSYQSLPNSSSAVPRVHTIQSKASPNSADEHIHQHSNTAFQRKQYSIKTNGVIEIYKPLMISLLGLLDLQSKDKTDELWPSYSDYAKAIGSMDSISNDGNENVLHHYAIEKLEVAIDTKDINIDDIPSGTKRKGISTQGPSKSKRTRPARSRILTRSEKKRRSEIKKALSMFSKQLTSIETRPEQWKELQFLHVRWLRWEWCESCSQELCLQCGESSHHESQVCFDYMRSLTTENDKSLDLQKKKSAKATGLQSPSVWSPTNSSRKGKDRSDLDANTIQWKLANTNPCPNCCILIHRDDGCNKVDCMLCGYRFCWICREAWGSACGFFNCGRKPTIPDPHNTVESAKINEGVQDRNTVNVRANMDDEGNIQSLAVSRELLMGTSQVDASLDLSQQDFHGRRSPEDAASEKPEIGVPNVFVIHTKRSRA